MLAETSSAALLWDPGWQWGLYPEPCHMSHQRERRPGRFGTCVIYSCLPVILVTSLSSLLDTSSCTALPVSRRAKGQPCQVCGKVRRRRNNAGKSWKAEYCAKCSHHPHWHSSLTVLFKYLAPHLVNDIKVSTCNGQGNWVWWEFLKIFCGILTLLSPGESQEMLTLFTSKLRDQLQSLDCVLWNLETYWTDACITAEPRQKGGWMQLCSAE